MPARIFSVIYLCLLAGLAFSLSACGGSGGSSSVSPKSAQSQLESPQLSSLVKIAENEPADGSVTQGSRGISGVTTDTVSFSSGDETVTIDDETVTIDKAGTTVTLNPVSVDVSDLGGAKVFRSADEEAIAVVVSDLTLPSVDSEASLDYDDTDPLVFGLWAYATDEGFELGVFADGLTATKTPASSIPSVGTASYEGKTLGFYRDDVDGTGGGALVGDVNLTAEFGAATPTVSGTIDNIFVDYSEEPVNLSVNLEEANIDPNVAGGFFTGDTTVDMDESPLPGASGKWGGQFFGDNADYVGGTWGFSNDAETFSAVGAFSAEKQ